MATPFRVIVGVVALVVFIVLMVLVYRAARAHNSKAKFPPSVPPCPDWMVSTDGGCVLPGGVTNRNVILDLIRAKNPSLADAIGAGKPMKVPGGSLCAFAQDNGLSWDGVTNVPPCLHA